MKILAFDTANNSASVSISDGQKILAYREELRASMQAETIVPMIEGALEDSRLSYNEISYLAVTNGPGSFTGIRIGLAVAKGILFGTKIKGIAVSNFEFSYFRAAQQVQNYDKIFIFLNAYRGQLYAQVFDKNGGCSDPALLDYDQAIGLLKKEKGVVVCAGSGGAIILNEVKDLVSLRGILQLSLQDDRRAAQGNSASHDGDRTLIILPRFARVKAMHICRYVESKLAAGQSLNNSIEPLYIRPADAKVKVVI